MAFFFFFVVTLITISTLILILSQFFKTRNSNSDLPPGNTGWPILGETLAFASNPEKFIRNRMMKYSPQIFKTSLVGEKMFVLCGPLANKLIFCNTKPFPTWWPLTLSKTLVYPINPDPNGKYLTFLEDHSFLKLDSIQNYVPMMDSMAKEHMDLKWDGCKEVKVHPLSKDFIFALSCRIFINLTDPTRVQDLAEAFFALSNGIVSAPVNFPGTLFHGAAKGSKVIREKVIEIITQRIVMDETWEDFEPKDLLGRMVVSADGNGKFLNREEIFDKIIGYLVCGLYTTSNAITFVLSHLAEHPIDYEMVLEEQMEIAKYKEVGEMLTWEDVQKMKYSWCVVLESMRLRPPCQGGFREVLTGFTFGGFHIPKGWKLFWTVHSTNKDPKYFPNPEKFYPSRFGGSGPRPFSFVPFGEGPGMCAGKEFARMEILVYLHNVVTRFRLKKAIPNEKIIYNSEPLPSQGLRMYLQAHEKC